MTMRYALVELGVLAELETENKELRSKVQTLVSDVDRITSDNMNLFMANGRLREELKKAKAFDAQLEQVRQQLNDPQLPLIQKRDRKRKGRKK